LSLLTDKIATDPVVALAAPRPEFNGALTEFLIGMVTVAFQPADERAWKDRWEWPPAPEEFEDALRGLPDAFRLDGAGPRFMQDLEEPDFEAAGLLPIERLLFDAPGEQAVEQNKDLFVKRGVASLLGPAAAAMALIAMQTYAPAGGKGYRTSLRGGGPLTTLVDPRDGGGADAFWGCLWANVESAVQWQGRSHGAPRTHWPWVFPWLGKTRTSDPKQGGVRTTPIDGNPLQVYFGMPRRIRLEFGPEGRCDLTGLASRFSVTGFRTRNYGVEYGSWDHPLTPYYRPKANAEWWPVHPQPDGIGWKDWVSLTLESADGTSMPARTVGHFHDRGLAVGLRHARLHAFGVDFDNMKCRGWVEARLPYLTVPDEQSRLRLRDLAVSLTKATDLTAAMTQIYVKAALFGRPEEVRGRFPEVSQGLWAGTERAFYEALGRLTGAAEAEAVPREKRAFHAALRLAALESFDRHCSLEGTAPQVLRRMIEARYRLSGYLAGFGKKGTELCTLLELPTPQTSGAKGAKGRKGRGKA
jgi:CRISPR system Cascade subunit CasA